MQEDPNAFLRLIALIAGPSVMGGALDYFRQIQTGEKMWSLASLLLHLNMAAFFGAICWAITTGLGYEGLIAGAASGLGGFLGVRVADLATMWLGRKSG